MKLLWLPAELVHASPTSNGPLYWAAPSPLPVVDNVRISAHLQGWSVCSPERRRFLCITSAFLLKQVPVCKNVFGNQTPISTLQILLIEGDRNYFRLYLVRPPDVSQ